MIKVTTAGSFVGPCSECICGQAYTVDLLLFFRLSIYVYVAAVYAASAKTDFLLLHKTHPSIPRPRPHCLQC